MKRWTHYWKRIAQAINRFNTSQAAEIFRLNVVKRINTLLGNIETALLCLIILSIVGLGILKIVLRYFFQISLLWNQVVLQHFILWLAFLGASLATCENRHISIDVLTRYLPKRLVQFTNILVHIVSFVIVSILAYTGFEFIRDEQASGATLAGAIPIWWAKLIIPIGFVLIALHFALHTIMAIIHKTKGVASSWER